MFDCCIAVIEHECADSFCDKKSFIDDSVGMSAESDAAAGSVGAVEDQIVHPVPPYTSADDEKLGDGITCYYPDCSATSHSYANMVNHVRSYHSRPARYLKGTYLYKRSCDENNAKQNERNKRVREAASAPTPTSVVPAVANATCKPHAKRFKSEPSDTGVASTDAPQPQKRCSQHEASANRREQQADLINQINIPVMQAAVRKGYMTLKAIEEKFGESPLPKNVRGHANAAMAGGIAFDTFSGRKMGWERLLRLYVIGVLHANGDHLVCSEHKTSMTYGSIAKLLTPGLFQAFLCYSRLHFPDGCETFLVPATEGARTVCLTSALNSFCSSHLPAKSPVWPTFNLQRKLFHRALMLLTEDLEKIKELMVVLDAPSHKVQRSHYILRDPAGDVFLAIKLVKAVLGDTVVWPPEHAMEESLQLTVWLKDHNANRTRNEDPQDECDSEDEELEHFEGAEIFGDFTMHAANATLTPLSDIVSGEGKDGIDSLPGGKIVAAQILTAHRFAPATTLNAMKEQNKKDEKDKKNKTDKKDKQEKKEKKEEKERKEQEDKDEPPQLMIEDGRTDGEDKDGYAYVKSGGSKRTKVDPCAHEYMRSAVREWQTRASKNENDKPYGNEWYRDLRIELIKKGKLSRNHSLDVCRSYIQKWVKTQPDTIAPAVAADVPEHEDAVVTTQPDTLAPAVAADVPEHEDSLSSATSAAYWHAASAAAWPAANPHHEQPGEEPGRLDNA